MKPVDSECLLGEVEHAAGSPGAVANVILLQLLQERRSWVTVSAKSGTLEIFDENAKEYVEPGEWVPTGHAEPIDADAVLAALCETFGTSPRRRHRTTEMMEARSAAHATVTCVWKDDSEIGFRFDYDVPLWRWRWRCFLRRWGLGFALRVLFAAAGWTARGMLTLA
ncbi:MAG: hypothetical protein JSV19_14095 [Phycisphaerales bacterium]|nr:MAG: hypothetical protein JSV19_14095 [Phycisphaerales bacterium]